MGAFKVEQISSDKELCLDLDKRLTAFEISRILYDCFDEGVDYITVCGHKIPYVVCSGRFVFLLIAQVTYLGNPHPIYKKRIQLKNWYIDAIIETNKMYKGCDQRFIGIYRYKDNIVFVDYDKTRYLNGRMHNSSAHVYTNDLFQAMEHGIFSKIDFFGNKITTISKDYFKRYILDDFTGNILIGNVENEIVNCVSSFNANSGLFNKTITVEEAISEMYKENYSQRKQSEWPGFFLQYKYEKFLNEEGLLGVMLPLKNKNKASKHLDFDLYFPKGNFYGDLKSSDISEKSTMLNDAANVSMEINDFGKLWYIIYCHDTKYNKDEYKSGPNRRIVAIRKFDPFYKLGNDNSYGQRLKTEVRYKEMYIIEINRINRHWIMDKMTSNFHQLNGGSLRNPKYSIKKDEFKNALVYFEKIR